MMLIYCGTKTDFMQDTENDLLENKLYETIKEKMNRTMELVGILITEMLLPLMRTQYMRQDAFIHRKD